MIFIRNTILILFVLFAVFYTLFNFSFVSAGARSLLGLIDKPIINQSDLLYEDGSARFFPISSNRVLTVDEIDTIPEQALNSSFQLSIPSLGINAPIVLERTISQERIFNQLEKGIVHYAATPLPGQKGTAVLIGHSSAYPWYGGDYGQIFASLSQLKNGDIIQIENDGDVFDYKVSHSIIFSPSSVNDFELRSLEYSDGSSVVLMTCWPTGTNSKRVAVRADLII